MSLENGNNMKTKSLQQTCTDDMHGNNINNFGWCASCTPVEGLKEETPPTGKCACLALEETCECHCHICGKEDCEIAGCPSSCEHCEPSPASTEDWEKRFDKQFKSAVDDFTKTRVVSEDIKAFIKVERKALDQHLLTKVQQEMRDYRKLHPDANWDDAIGIIMALKLFI